MSLPWNPSLRCRSKSTRRGSNFASPIGYVMTEPQGSYKVLIPISESPLWVAEHVTYLGNPGSYTPLNPAPSCRQAGFADAVEEPLRGRRIGDQQQPGQMDSAQVGGKAANLMNGVVGVGLAAGLSTNVCAL